MERTTKPKQDPRVRTTLYSEKSKAVVMGKFVVVVASASGGGYWVIDIPFEVGLPGW
jgi:hypothetical protein